MRRYYAHQYSSGRSTTSGDNEMSKSDEFINITTLKTDSGETRYEIELFQGINILQTDRGGSDAGFVSRESAERYARGVFSGVRIE